MKRNGWQKERDEDQKARGSSGTSLHMDPDALVGMWQDKFNEIWSMHELFDDASRQYVDAHTKWKMERAKAYLMAQGPQGQREAQRDLDTAEAYRQAQIAEAMKEAMHQRIMSLRLEVSGLQTQMGVQKEEMKMTGAKAL